MNRFGHNRGYIEELYQSYLADPASVSEAWRDYFADFRPDTPSSRAAKPARRPPDAEDAEPLRGASARIVANMQRSLTVPTATSARTVPVKTLVENRRLINLHQETVSSARISFTHLIAWAVVRALEQHPIMNTGFVEVDGRPHRVPRDRIHLGIAIDLERKGERVLLVPNIRGAETLDFPTFVAAFDDLVVRARDNRLEVEDFQETTVTLTNPGMLGTGLSVPRLMEGQGAIIGTGSIGYPAAYAGMAPEVISDLGISQVMTITSTYDHRVIQGAASGSFLAAVEKLVQGEGEFYESIFAELGVANEPILWGTDRNPPISSLRGDTEAIAKQACVLQLIRAYRVRGHLWADVDPLGYEPEPHPELELAHYGLSIWDLDRRFIAGGLGGSAETLELREILEILNRSYCRNLGVEYMHIQDTERRRWLQQRLEVRDTSPPPRDEQIRILKKLNAAEAFESFIGTNYVGQKRFSLEGAETLIPMLDFLLGDAADGDVEEVVIGMAHRGRLNVLTNIVGKAAGQIFREFEGDLDPLTTHGSGDVKYHLGASGTYVAPSGREIGVRVASNPSHLEAVNPVVEGMVRANQDRRGDSGRQHVLPLLIHGDAAFSGQGVVAETLNLSQLKGYRTGGTVHVVVNNQIGFTTGPADLRSSFYSTDVAKMVGAPIFHVNADRPEDAVRAIRLALAYRQEFKQDVVVDLVCYRRWGHNEADDPSYTHPILYAKIESHRSVRKLYTDELLRRGDFDPQTAEKALEDFRKRLRRVHDDVRQAQSVSAKTEDALPPRVLQESSEGSEPATAVDRETLLRVLDGLERLPEGFHAHPKLAKQLARRRGRFDGDRVDWALAEAFAFGTLAIAGTPVRLSGEDSGRGTFSHRHATLYDYRTGEAYTPLSHLADDQAPFHVFDSLLSEFAVLGFEYGFSAAYPEALVLWEAQFGDFSNGAQVIIDQFMAGAERKWKQTSGVTLLLPHGYEGQGPEHSSARLERFLQLTAGENFAVANPSTPAQFFHLLRSQALRQSPRPLVVMTPKSLLRHRDCVSTREELSSGAFHEILDDPRKPGPDTVGRVLFCSGKVFYDLDAGRGESPSGEVALCRIEQLSPFPADAVAGVLRKYAAASEVAWVQEEPSNMGAWDFVREPLRELMQDGKQPAYVGRPRSSSPATGSQKRHAAEQSALVRDALRPATSRVST